MVVTDFQPLKAAIRARWPQADISFQDAASSLTAIFRWEQGVPLVDAAKWMASLTETAMTLGRCVYVSMTANERLATVALMFVANENAPT